MMNIWNLTLFYMQMCICTGTNISEYKGWTPTLIWMLAKLTLKDVLYSPLLLFSWSYCSFWYLLFSSPQDLLKMWRWCVKIPIIMMLSNQSLFVSKREKPILVGPNEGEWVWCKKMKTSPIKYIQVDFMQIIAETC